MPIVAEAIIPPSNEDVVWGYLKQNGFSNEQAAGVMGNLQQEHNFRTDGDGLAQWTDGRLANLLALPNARDINVQVKYLVDEMSTTESYAGELVRSATTIEDATILFQNSFERCNPLYCMQAQRIGYAYDFYGRYK